MNKTVYLLLGILITLATVGCKDYSKVSFYAPTAEEVMTLVKQHKDDLEKINDAYEAKNMHDVYLDIDHYLELLWASPEEMNLWYKIWMASMIKSKRYAKDPKQYDGVFCQALICFIRTQDNKSIRELPNLGAHPIFEYAKKQYLHSTPQEFALWAKGVFNLKTVPKHWYYAIVYFQLLEAAAVSAGDNELAKNANAMLYYHNGYDRLGDLVIVVVSNVAFYADKQGELNNEDKVILSEFYNKYMKTIPLNDLDRKRGEFILKIIKKYNVIPDVTIPASK